MATKKSGSLPSKMEAASDDAPSRKYLSQSDVPTYSLAHAMRVPRAIAENYGKAATKPLRVAQAMDLSPGSSYFRVLTGSAIAYGLTEGGYASELIALTPLGRRAVAPTKEGDDLAARREALLRPRVVRDFLTRYNGSRVPVEHIARNVLEEIGVPSNKTSEVLELIIDGAKELGFLREVKGQTYVDLDGTDVPSGSSSVDEELSDDAAARPDDRRDELVAPASLPSPKSPVSQPIAVVAPSAKRISRVFITHGKNTEIVSQLKELLNFGGFTPVVAIEQETLSKPVPDKVLDDMRSCDAAIIHVGTDMRLIDAAGKEHKMLNQNVLIEIGAAMALYDRKFILLVERGATLPSNLQGLYEVRYEGEKLDYESTMKLLKAFNDFRG